MKKLFYLAIVLCGFHFTYAQDSIGPIATDRPNATFSSSMMTYKYLQIESGGIYEELNSGGVKQDAFTLNTTVLRYGLLENLEVQAGWGFSEIKARHGSDFGVQSGFSPVNLGAKVGVTEQMGWVPKMTIFSQFTFPFGAGSDFRNETTGVDVRMLFSNSLGGNSNLSYNVGANWLNDSAEATYLYTLTYGYAFTPLLGGFAEVYGNFPENGHAGHSWDIGLTYLFLNNLQADVLIGSGFDTEQNFQVAAGLSYRFWH